MPRVRLLCVDNRREKCCVDPSDDKGWRPVRGWMKIRVESSHKADEVPGRPEKVQPHRREIRSYSKVYGQLVSVREGKPCWTGSGLPLHVATQIDAVTLQRRTSASVSFARKPPAESLAAWSARLPTAL